MAQRQATRTVKSDAVQGEGSYVILKKTKYGEAKDLRSKAKDENVDEFEFLREYFVHYIVDWDWVDDEGKRLPLPKDTPAVVDDLNEDEIKFLSDALKGPSEESLKN